MIVTVSKEEAAHRSARPGVMSSGEEEGMPYVGPTIKCETLP